jgi:hypothetical protein
MQTILRKYPELKLKQIKFYLQRSVKELVKFLFINVHV